ncbi:ABC transporter permease [Acinetobacter baumannii]|nr:ABC transporter permease [Acinetobacter baumannii]MDC4919656.1 ABC transporter permease [Acinetobacter baumannii]MDC4934114.1 ABC transporter permease [Acinetobacter baumannii]
MSRYLSSVEINRKKSSFFVKAYFLLFVFFKHFLTRPFYIFAVILSFIVVSSVTLLTFSVRNGLENVIENTHEPGLFFIKNGISNSELTSFLTKNQQHYIENIIGVNSVDNKIIYSPELVLLTRQILLGTSRDFVLRGVTDQAFIMRNPINNNLYSNVIDGVLFQPGKREVIVGQALAKRYPELNLGKKIRISGSDWKIVGIFKSGGSVRESEIWADKNLLRNYFKLGDLVNIISFYSEPHVSLNVLNRSLTEMKDNEIVVTNSKENYKNYANGFMDLMQTFGVAFTFIGGVIVFSGIAVLVESVLINMRAEIITLKLIGYDKILFFCFTIPFFIFSLIGVFISICLYGLISYRLNFGTLVGFTEVVFVSKMTFTLFFYTLIYCLGLVFIACLINYNRFMNLFKFKVNSF